MSQRRGARDLEQRRDRHSERPNEDIETMTKMLCLLKEVEKNHQDREMRDRRGKEIEQSVAGAHSHAENSKEVTHTSHPLSVGCTWCLPSKDGGVTIQQTHLADRPCRVTRVSTAVMSHAGRGWWEGRVTSGVPLQKLT